MPIITPRVLKGFRDFLPDAEMTRKALIEKLETVFSSFGFVPIDTPVLEYAEILLGKGGGETDKQVYRFKDHGDRDVAMRFDLTVPFARFMAEHVDELYLPFRRYHIAKVWRGENTQRGRYREFMQCDFDIVGTDSASADADILLTAASAMRALEVGEFKLRINHRMLFNRFLDRLGASEKSVEILRTVDKREKIGDEATASMLAELVSSEAAREILEFIRQEKDFTATLEKMTALCSPQDQAALAARNRLLDVMECAASAGYDANVILDPSITRGLDYYTGMVLETQLSALPEIGSVCSGGRYDELASLYTTRKLPGVGASVGLDRLIAAMEALGKIGTAPRSTAILIINQEGNTLASLHAVASQLRTQGIASEVYPESRKLAVQYTYAEKKHIPLALFVQPEHGAGTSLGTSAAAGALSQYILRVLSRRENLECGTLEQVRQHASRELARE